MSPTSGETSGAVEGGKIPPDEEEKNLAEKDDKKADDGIDTQIDPNGKDMKEQITQVPADIEGQTSEGGSAMINKEQTHLLAVLEEKDVPEKPHLKKKKENKRKRSELEQIRIEEQLGDTEKKRSELVQIKIEGQFGGAEKKMSEIAQIKTEGQLGCIEKIQVPAETKEPASEACSPQRWLASYRILFKEYKAMMLKGSILVNANMNRVLLHNADKTLIDSRCLREGELFYPGLVFHFPCHEVQVGEPIVEEDPPLLTIVGHGAKKEMRYEKDRKKLKKRPDENCEGTKELRRKKKYKIRKLNKNIVRSPQAQLVRSSIGTFARVASLRKEMSPRAQQSKSESPSTPNVTAHFPSPNLPHAAKSTRFQPRKLVFALQGVAPPEMAEALALQHAAHLAQEEGFERVIFASDCLSLIQRLRSSSLDRLLVGLVVDDMKWWPILSHQRLLSM